MKTKAVRLYGKNDLRLEEFDLPALKGDEILARVVSDSICMSSYKAAIQGADHKRVPDDVARNPVIIGHEFCGEILEVGAKWREKFRPGARFAIQPALNYQGSFDAPGYSFHYIGGAATRIVIPNEVMEMGCLLEFRGDAFFLGSLAEPMSCIIGAFRANYHTTGGSYKHKMGIAAGGNAAILAGAGNMGLGAVDYAVHGTPKPALLVVTDVDDARLARAAVVHPPAEAAKHGVRLEYVNTAGDEDPVGRLRALADGRGYDDVFVMAPVRAVVEQADRILARDGCLNFFAGPTDPAFSAGFNFYNVHYAATHLVGTSGGNTDDMVLALRLMEQGALNPAAMITHVGGLDSAIGATLNLPAIPGGKKLIYTNIRLELTALEDLRQAGEKDPLKAKLAEIVAANSGFWSAEAEKFLLANARPV